jgi:hypothetical protein
VFAAALAAILGACDGGDGSPPSSSASAGGGPVAACEQYTTCGSCTPQNGCGWCFNAAGGYCVTDPDQCAFSSNNEFTWTWNASGCPDADASVGPASHDAGSKEASSPVPEAATPVEAAAAAADAEAPEAGPSEAGPSEAGAEASAPPSVMDAAAPVDASSGD